MSEQASIKDQFKYASADSLTLDMLARALQLKRVVVGEKLYLPEPAADRAAATDVWGDDAILAYVPEGANYRIPAFGYTYELSGYPQVSKPYFEARNDSWIYPMKTERRPIIVGADAGFLFTNAGRG